MGTFRSEGSLCPHSHGQQGSFWSMGVMRPETKLTPMRKPRGCPEADGQESKEEATAMV